MSYECPHGIPMYLVKNFGCDDCINDQIVTCQGIHIADKDYSGCNANETGATDCPACGELVKAHKRMEALQMASEKRSRNLNIGLYYCVCDSAGYKNCSIHLAITGAISAAVKEELDKQQKELKIKVNLLREALERMVKVQCRCKRYHHSTNTGCEQVLAKEAAKKALAATEE